MIKVDIISGFLGAGKTTLIKKLFESNIKNEKVVLIENEFGQIGIDGSFLKESGVEIKEINSGCICCSLVGDFEKSLKEVISTYTPERIIIEPSGVGKLSDIVNAVKKIHDEDLHINILCTVVDGAKAKLHFNNFGEFFKNQVETAASIVVAKVDKISEEKLAQTVEIIKDVNDDASIITTNISELNGNDLLEFLEEKTTLSHLIEEVEHEHHHEHDEHCYCHEHHHEHDEHCHCHEHEHHHEHDEECCCHEHHHEHDEHCHCHEHEHHEHDEECCCHEHKHHHEHDEHCCCHEHHHDHHHHDADEVFTSWGLETVKSISKDELSSFLDKLSTGDYGLILRSKGILKASDNDLWYYFDYVSGDYEIRLGNPSYTGRFVVIGSELHTHKIEELFYKG